MPPPKTKRILVLQSNFEEYDRSELAAAGKLIIGNDGPNLLRTADETGAVLEGRGDGDLLVGGAGDDLLIGFRAAFGDDPRDGESDLDNILGVFTGGLPSGGDTLMGGRGDDLLFGADQADRLLGGAGDDALFGFDGDDLLNGGAGDDTLAGDFGSNTLRGGDGADTASWADLSVRDRPRDSQGVALNLSDQTIRYGFGPVDFLVAAGTASHRDASGFGVDTLRDIEFFDGSAGASDIAFLDASFAFAGTDAAGFTAYTDGTDTVFLRGFENIVFA